MHSVCGEMLDRCEHLAIIVTCLGAVAAVRQVESKAELVAGATSSYLC